MAKEKLETIIVQAKAYWCKLIGKPRPTYDENGLEWTVDILWDKVALEKLKEFGISGFYIKKGKPNKDNTPNELTGKPITKFVRKAHRADGSPANPVTIRDENGDPWDGKTLIGNGSVVNLKITKTEVALKGQPRRNKPILLELQVWDLVPYEGAPVDGGFPTKGNKEAKKKNDDEFGFEDESFKDNHQKDLDFDDEIPF